MTQTAIWPVRYLAIPTGEVLANRCSARRHFGDAQSDDRLDAFWGGLGVRIPLQAPAEPWYDWLRALVTEP